MCMRVLQCQQTKRQMVTGVVLAIYSDSGIYGSNVSVVHKDYFLHSGKYYQLDEIGGT